MNPSMHSLEHCILCQICEDTFLQSPTVYFQKRVVFPGGRGSVNRGVFIEGGALYMFDQHNDDTTRQPFPVQDQGLELYGHHRMNVISRRPTVGSLFLMLGPYTSLACRRAGRLRACYQACKPTPPLSFIIVSAGCASTQSRHLSDSSHCCLTKMLVTCLPYLDRPAIPQWPYQAPNYSTQHCPVLRPVLTGPGLLFNPAFNHW